MNNLMRLNQATDYIEKNLTSEIWIPVKLEEK